MYASIHRGLSQQSGRERPVTQDIPSEYILRVDFAQSSFEVGFVEADEPFTVSVALLVCLRSSLFEGRLAGLECPPGCVGTLDFLDSGADVLWYGRSKGFAST